MLPPWNLSLGFQTCFGCGRLTSLTDRETEALEDLPGPHQLGQS